VTKPRKHIGILPGLPWAARKWLLGARVYYDDNDELRNSGIVRLQHLIIKARTDADWQRYLDGLQAEWGPVVRAKREVRQAAREARKAARAARKARREVEALSP
jgi:hypothetical protein